MNPMFSIVPNIGKALACVSKLESRDRTEAKGGGNGVLQIFSFVKF